MVRNMLAILSTLSIPSTPTRSAHFRAVSFSFSSFRSLACVRPIIKHCLASRHSPIHNVSDPSDVYKSGAATSKKIRGFGSHFGRIRMPNISRNERKFEFNNSTSGALGCAIFDQRTPVMQAAQHVTDLHGWTDPMQDAWAEVWTSPVVPKSEPSLAEIPRSAVLAVQPHPHPNDSTLPPNQSASVPQKWSQPQFPSLPQAPLPPEIGTQKESALAEEQRTPEWFAKREGRLTASAFGNAVGLWQSGRNALWEEKIGLGKAFTGNAATRWGTSQEATALSCYSSLTGNDVHPLSFQVYKPDDPVHDWLGASPDGLLQGDRWGKGVGDGVLEVKCPYNKGYPEEALVPNRVPSYYMPQAQGLLEILDREWLDFYVWTPNGSVVFRVERDPKYWALMYSVLSTFWWSHVVPAREMVKEGKLELVNQFKPPEQDVLTKMIKGENNRLVRAAVPIWLEENGVIKELRV